MIRFIACGVESINHLSAESTHEYRGSRARPSPETALSVSESQARVSFAVDPLIELNAGGDSLRRMRASGWNSRREEDPARRGFGETR